MSGTELAAIDWRGVGADLDAHGATVIRSVLPPASCSALAALYDEDDRFRSRVVMARHGFGRGEYKYFAYPLPELVAGLRRALYLQLASIANRWNEALGVSVRYPAEHSAFLERFGHGVRGSRGQLEPLGDCSTDR